jgi:quercetin dioxygenase-like cupin family protein
MFTRRDLLIALGAATLTAAAFALAGQSPVLRSVAIDWNSVPDKPNNSGSLRTFFRSRTATLDELEVHVTTLNPGQAPHAPHRHGNEELLIVKQGSIEALIDGEWKRVGPGSVVFFASNQLHGVRNPGHEPAVYHVIGFRTPATPPNETSAQTSGSAKPN